MNQGEIKKLNLKRICRERNIGPTALGRLLNSNHAKQRGSALLNNPRIGVSDKVIDMLCDKLKIDRSEFMKEGGVSPIPPSTEESKTTKELTDALKSLIMEQTKRIDLLQAAVLGTKATDEAQWARINAIQHILEECYISGDLKPLKKLSGTG